MPYSLLPLRQVNFFSLLLESEQGEAGGWAPQESGEEFCRAVRHDHLQVLPASNIQTSEMD
jgi:hypothetical protein